MPIDIKYGFETKFVSGGKYAKVLANCGENLESWYGLYAWIEKNGYVFRDEPPFEKYLDELDKPKTTESRVEIFVPIE